ncbi:MAG: hypothetical protein RSA27_04770, partial [Oscillospiraceae bacterium]
QELEINLEDIYDVENNTISYTDKNGKTKKQAYSGTIAVVFNGASTKKPFTMDLLKDANGTFKKGNIKLLDSKNDGSYDVIFAEVYDECVVGQTMGTNYTVYDYYEPQKTFKLDTSQDDPFVVLNDKNGNEMSFLSLEQFDTLMIYKSLDDAYQERIIVNVSKARMSGTIKAITNKDGKRHITLDDKDVVFSDIYAKYCEGELKVGQSVELSLDINGEAVGVRKIVESNVYRWGYIIGVHEENGLEKSLSAKIMKDDKNIALVQFDKKIKIDGVSFKNDKDKNTKIILWLEKASKAISGVSAERCTAQLLKYKLSNKGTIIEIDTVLNDKGEETKFGEASDNNSVYRRKLTNEYYYSSVDTIGGKTILSNDTKVFVCPSISAINTEYQDEKLYSVMGKSYFINCDQYSLNAFYSLEDTATAEAVIIYGSTGSVGDLPTNAPTYMVAEINEGLDKDGMVAKKVHLTNGSEDITITCPDTVKSDGAPNITVDGLNIGDVILVSKNTYCEMAGFQVLYDRKNDTLLNNNTSFIAYRRVISGYIYDVYKDCLVLAKTTDKALIPSFIQSDGLEFVPKNNFPVVVYDSTMPEDSKKVTSGSIKDVIGYATSVEECSKVVLQYSYGVPLSMMIIK